jgi:transposase-like protein
MPQKSPYVVKLTNEERHILEKRSRSYTSPYFEVMRAKIVLYAADGLENLQIAERVDTPRQVVSKWRKRFFEERLDGLEDRDRSGRPPVFSPLGPDRR